MLNGFVLHSSKPFINHSHQRSPFIQQTLPKTQNTATQTSKFPLLREEISLRRSQNRPSTHRHDINHISHRAHIIRHYNIERSVLELPRLLSISHHIAFARVFADFALRPDHVIHVVRTVQDQTAHVHGVVQRLHLADADRRCAAGPRIVG